MTDTHMERHSAYLSILLAYLVVWADLLLGLPLPSPFTPAWFISVTLKNAVRIAVILYISASPAFGQSTLKNGRTLLMRLPERPERRQAVTVAVLSLACAGIGVAAAHLAGSSNPLFEHGSTMSPAILIPFALVSSVSVGYAEEMFFRFFMIDGLTSAGAPAAVAASLSVIVFALSHHAQGMYGILFAAVIAVLYTFLRLKRYGLHSLALGHALYDALILLCALA